MTNEIHIYDFPLSEDLQDTDEYFPIKLYENIKFWGNSVTLAYNPVQMLWRVGTENYGRYFVSRSVAEKWLKLEDFNRHRATSRKIQNPYGQYPDHRQVEKHFKTVERKRKER